MKPPFYMTIKIQNAEQHKVVMEALNKAEIKYPVGAIGLDDFVAMTEAYVMVSGTKIASGTLPDMRNRFKDEVASHSAPVTLYVKEGGSYVVKQRRSPQNTRV